MLLNGSAKKNRFEVIGRIWVRLRKSIVEHLVKPILLIFVQCQRIRKKMKLITIKEVSEILNIKPSTLYQWAELGQIPCIKLNGALRFDMDDIKKWVDSCKKVATSSYNPFAQTARGPGKEGRKNNGTL